MKKIKVRVAVAVDTNGDWAADGDSTRSDKRAADGAAAWLMPDRSTVYFLEAELDAPEPVTVQAEVTQ